MLPLPNQSKATLKISQSDEHLLTAKELTAFMDKHGFSDQGLADFLGVTLQAVRLWKRNQRVIQSTTTRIIRLMDKYPHLMKEF